MMMNMTKNRLPIARFVDGNYDENKKAPTIFDAGAFVMHMLMHSIDNILLTVIIPLFNSSTKLLQCFFRAFAFSYFTILSVNIFVLLFLDLMIFR